jgi:hypothetical protein
MQDKKHQHKARKLYKLQFAQYRMMMFAVPQRINAAIKEQITQKQQLNVMEQTVNVVIGFFILILK